jgi:DNA helicase MCM9
MDLNNSELDLKIAEHILKEKNSLFQRPNSDEAIEPRQFNNSLTFNTKQMQSYISFVRRIEPLLTTEANTVLTKYYQLQRKTDGNQSARTTIRMLESLIRLKSLIRLATAHARLMNHASVELVDAFQAILIMETGMNSIQISATINDFRLDHNDQEYSKFGIFF